MMILLYQSSDNSNANVAESEKTPEAPVMESEEILEEAVKEAAATKEEYKPEPVVEVTDTGGCTCSRRTYTRETG